MKDVLQQFVKPKPKFPWRKVGVVFLVFGVLLGIVVTGIIAYGSSYQYTVLPGIHIGNIPIGGMNEEDLKNFLQDMNDKLVAEGVTIEVEKEHNNTEEFTFYPVVVTETNSLELFTIDVPAEVSRIIAIGKEGNVFSRAATIFRSRVQQPHIALQHISVQEERIEETVQDYVAQFETPGNDAKVVVDLVTPLQYHVVSSTKGITFDISSVSDTLKDQWALLAIPTVHLTPKVDEPEITTDIAEQLAPRVENIFTHEDILLTYTHPYGRQQEWRITTPDIARWLTIYDVPDNGYGFGLNQASTTAFIEKRIATSVNVEAQDAKFAVNNAGRVVEFQSSRPGIAINIEETFEALNNAVMARTWHDEGVIRRVSVVVEQSEPLIKTGEVNDLGISEVLGTGISRYTGSPSNRIKNIRNAVRKLDGILVAPGEEFSTIAHTQPYTLEGGYLPELVIKGDEVKPEIGGGLCQIGTTLFRMAMKSGLDITQRRNHSLVVGYYNDLENGLPGTDATLYDPAPDFRFKNDTGSHILIDAYMDEANQELQFTLWGTNDGRKADYTAPVVSKWIPYGETKIIETTKLAPGEKNCQHAYTGADASFTYSRTLADGTTEDRVFESHYRPLPEICLVGVEPEEEGVVCEDGDEECMNNPPTGGQATNLPDSKEGDQASLDATGESPISTEESDETSLSLAP